MTHTFDGQKGGMHVQDASRRASAVCLDADMIEALWQGRRE